MVVMMITTGRQSQLVNTTVVDKIMLPVPEFPSA